MTTSIIETKGSWGQIAAQVPRFRKHKMRLTLLPENTADTLIEDSTLQNALAECAAWLMLSAQRVQDAYSDDKPDYPLSSIREMNPHYEAK